MMIETLKNIITNVLIALYQPFGFAIVLTVLFMVTYMYAEEIGYRTVVQRWIHSFKTSRAFRRVLLLTFYTAFVLFRTLLNRSLDLNALSDVMGVWGLYTPYGTFTTEVIENIILFVPFTTMLWIVFGVKIVGQKKTFFKIIWNSLKIVFCLSLAIELIQVLFRVGHFQLSDLFYNTLGGLIGGLIYWCGYKITHRNKRKQ